MSWYHTVSPARLSDDRLRGASLLARYLWDQFLVSELATKLPGVARGGLATIAEHVDATPDETLRAMQEMQGRGAIEFDLVARVVRLVGVALDDFEVPAKSSPTISGWLRVARELPRCEVLARQCEEFAALCPLKAPEWLAVAARCRKPTLRALAGETVPSAGPPEAPTEGTPSSDLDPDPDPDLDLDPPLSPKGETSDSLVPVAGLIADDERGRNEVDEALRVLVDARSELGLPPLPPTAREVRRVVAQLVERDALPLLPTLIRRRVEQIRSDLAGGRDERSTLTLRGVVRRLDALAAVDDHRARAPPSNAIAAPITDTF